LKIAFKKRGMQANIIAKYIAKSPYPVIVCGDFNDTPTSYAYNTIKGTKLKDSFIEKGFGMAKTYNGSMPSFRIDYILSDSTFTTKSFDVMNHVKDSDHFPVVAEFSKH
jgi:endonuclease/exonuclease/phosphatase family metal-dependent hydrolase